MELLYQIAITQIEGVGNVIAKNLISHCGSASAVFKAKKSTLLKIPEIGEYTANSVINFKDFIKAENELKFIEKHKIQTYFYASQNYPYRLKSNSDCPIILYQLGNTDLNAEKIVAIVGTRKPSEYGKNFCEKLINDLSELNVTVISGMAFGVDICAHKVSLKNNLPTVGILAHGLDRVYPAEHKKYAENMIKNGGALVTEFLSGTNPDRENFPRRNRIVAGLSDAVVVVETALRGGSMITAELAWQYDRLIFALPGRTNDEKSVGCNFLIKTNKAEMIENANDLIKSLGWNIEKNIKSKQKQLPINLNEDEKQIFNLFKNTETLEIDKIINLSGLNSGQVALTLLDLEIKGYIKTLPGKRFQIL
ncbi:MAG: DNA-protecting protein DprA [Bacteroidetes bacterium]|nr:DNA-protecting protein DprA [Bacteroidota bacterium]